MSRFDPPDIRESEATSEQNYLNRRGFITLGAASLLLPAPAEAAPADQPTAFEAITTYNNFYEFGPGKDDPARIAPKTWKTTPWTIEVSGECAKPAKVAVENLIHPKALEERLYRMRCVETWSMVIPWLGVPLGPVLSRFEPSSKAKFVEFVTLDDPVRLPGMKLPILDWPYVEALRIDEAMHPLTLLAVGLYGKELLPQNGAPIRLVVPWKYGFKSIKSIVAIRFVEKRPVTSWIKSAPAEYGFYANVNPSVDHPRWSQASERRIGEFRRRDTLMFNGYAEQVAHLYAGQNLARDF